MRHGRQTPLVLSDAKSCVVSRWPLIVVYSKDIRDTGPRMDDDPFAILDSQPATQLRVDSQNDVFRRDYPQDC